MTTPPRDVADWATWTYIEPDDDPYGLKEAVRASAEEFVNRNHTPTSAHPNAVNAVALNLPKMPIGKPSHEYKVGGPEAIKFGMAVFNMRTSNGTVAEVDNAEFDPLGRLKVWGHFSHPDEADVLGSGGSFSRIFDGHGGVKHDNLSVIKSWQGQGIATEFNAHAEQMYRAYGIRTIHLEAAMEVGGYSWAVAGYDWESGSVKPQIRDQMSALAHGALGDNMPHGIKDTRLGTPTFVLRLVTPTVAAEFGALVSRINAGEHVAPYEIAQVGRSHTIEDGKSTLWAGKALLLGNQWHGVKRLDPLPKVSVNTPETKAADRARLKAIMNASRQ